MEFLWVDLELESTDLVTQADSVQFDIRTGSPPTAIGDISEGSVIAKKHLLKQVTTSGADLLEMPLRMDLTDKNGFGQLVATDRVNISGVSSGMSAAVVFEWRIYYRYVTVGAEEYIGIVQSQTMG